MATHRTKKSLKSITAAQRPVVSSIGSTAMDGV
jgi:hypothetical protein